MSDGYEMQGQGPDLTCQARLLEVGGIVVTIQEIAAAYLGRITPRRIMGDTTWSEIWKSQSVGSLLTLNFSSNPPI